MAEAFGLAANIISIVHITSQVIKRLNDFKNTADGVPRALQAISNELPTLKLTLSKVRQADEAGCIPDDSKAALKPLLTGLEAEISAIAEIIENMRPRNSSTLARNFKAIKSLRYDDDIKHHEQVIRGYVSTLSLERIVSGPGKDLATLRPPLVSRNACPFGQDPDFIERPVLADLLAQCGPGSRRALVGGGGMGKSQLAISYGHKVHQAHPETWIFWIDAESVSKFEQGYRAIADEVRIAGRSDKDADILNLVYEWLRNANNGNWVLILDNANNKDVFTSQPSASHQAQSEKQLQDFLPRSSNGSILVTSRSREAAFMVTCNYKHIFTVEQMSENEAMALLQSHLDEAHDEDEMKRLLEMLGNVPLAVAQAAANISRRSLSMSEYRQELHKGDEFSPGTLDESTPQLRRDSTRSNSIVATWRITFEYVRRTAPSAARLLSLMCLFDHQEIPQSLLEGQYGEEVNASPLKSRKVWWKRRLRMERRKQPTVPPKSLPPTFEDDWLILRDFSLIKPNKDKKHFSMHPLVQFITGKWLVSHGEHECWSYQYISIISAQLGVAELEGRLKKGPLLAHAYAAVPYRPSDTAIRPLQDWGVITFGIAMYYHQRLAWDLALKLLHVAAEAFELTLGNGAPQVLRCNTERGNIYSNLKQYTEAEIMHRRTLDIHSQLLGVEHPDTLVSMTRVGDALADLRRDAEADELYRKFLEMHVTTLGPLHPDTQEAFTTCGMFYFLRGRKKDAYDMFRQAHEAKCQGKNDYYDMSWPSRIRGIGLNFQLKGNLEQAELYYREAVSEMEKGAEEHDLIECINHLANVLLQQENFAEAEGLYQRAMAWYDAQDLKKHEECLRTMRDLAFVLLKLDKYEAAEQVAMKCLSEAEEKYGSDPVETLPITWILGCVLEKQHHYEASLQLLKQAFEGAKEKQGENHADTNMFESDYTRLFEKLRNITPETRSKSQSVLLGPHSNNDTLGGAEADDRVSEVDITANE